MQSDADAYMAKWVLPFAPAFHRQIWAAFGTNLRKSVPYIPTTRSCSDPADEFAACLEDDMKAFHATIAEVISLISSVDPQWNRYMIVKGITLQPFYGDTYLRRYRDIDIIARRPEDLCEIAVLLGESGFSTVAGGTSYPRWLSPNGPYFFVDMAKEDTRYPEIEVHAGGWPISFRTGIPWDELKMNSEIRTVFDLPCRVPTPDWTLLMLVAEQYERFEIRARDLFDMMFLLPKVDIRNIWPAMEQYDLTQFFVRLATALIDTVQEPTVSDKLGQYRFPQKWPFSNWTISRNLVHVYPVLRRRYGTQFAIWNTITNYLEEYRCYLLRNTHRFTLVKLMTRWTPPERLLKSGRYLHLFQITTGARPWQVRERWHNVTLLHTPMGTFVLTANLLESDDHIAAAVKADVTVE